MQAKCDEQIKTDENKLKEEYDPVVRSLFIIIFSIVVLSIAVVELWLWAN